MKNKQVKRMMCNVLLSVTPQAEKIEFVRQVCGVTEEYTGRTELYGVFFNFHTQREFWGYIFNLGEGLVSIKADGVK